MITDLTVLAQHVIDGHADEVSRLTRNALEEGLSPAEILEQGLIAPMRVVGLRFRENVIFVPEVLVAARAMKAGMSHLEPILAASGIEPVGTFVIGTVKGDIHDIGKNLVGMMLRGAGFRVVDLGVNVPLERFLAAVDEHRPELVGMSALLTTTMGQMKVVLDAFREAGALERCRVMVGGAAVSEEWATAIGAHGFGKDAPAAVARALDLLDEVRTARSAGGG
jgi:corrinoid protein of di/trimethylamine methyltransferase